MKCPYCNSSFEGNLQYCPVCDQPLSRAAVVMSEPEPEIELKMPEVRPAPVKTPLKQSLRGLAIGVGVALAILGLYRLTFWITNYRIDRLYTRGKYTPTVNEVTLEDGRAAHTIAYYGNSGDQLYIPELKKSLIITGNVARITVPDGNWFVKSDTNQFDGDVSDVDSAEVSLSPVLITERGERTRLPRLKFTVDAPYSPLKITRPAKNGQSVMTSIYELNIDVVPDSTVFLNGENISDKVTRGGELVQAVKVQPIGTNTYTLVVRTPQHKETRFDIELYRQAYAINVELDGNIVDHTSNNTMAITGIADPEADMTVESKHIADSFHFDRETGRFEFIAEMENFGNNVVRFRLTKPGVEDALLSMNVEYTPSLMTYSAKAWKLDYNELRNSYAQWTGKVFLCEGRCVDSFSDSEGNAYIIMDVSSDNSGQYLVLQNTSTTKTITINNRYSCYADVIGRYIYNGAYYPMLCARYVDLINEAEPEPEAAAQ